MFDYGFGMGFRVFNIMFMLVFVMMLIVFAVTLVRGIGQWNKNNHSPRLTVQAEVCAKREEVAHHHHNDTGTGAVHMTSSTTYYVTFQVESGDRMEFRVSGREYGMLAEGDRGQLSFQGTRYLGFERG